MIRCKWCNLKNEKYIEYHDKEWCKSNFEDKYLFEMLILESFQAGLSWECVLNKREDFRKAFDNFDIEKICNYNDEKIHELLKNEKMLETTEKVVYSCLDLFPRNVSEIQVKTGLDARILMETLMTLEMEGYIKETAKNYYVRMSDVR